MRNYDYRDKWQKLLTPEIVSMLTQIHEYKGEQSLFIEAKADTLVQLMEIAKIQSTEASNKIDIGMYLILSMRAMNIFHRKLLLFCNYIEIYISLKDMI